MATGSAERMRRWQGPAVLSFGFRPFFLFGALWAALAMLAWIGMLGGHLALPSRFDPLSWHAHEFLFGYLGAILAGFLLTAVPNWTGRLPVVGWQLGGLFGLWLLGRGAVAVSAALPAAVAIAADLAFPLVLGALVLREIVAGRNWRNLIVLALVVAFTLANLIFHLEAARGAAAAQGYGLRLGLATALMMISVIGGRIVPSFTRNWLVREGARALPAPPMQRFDRVVLLASVVLLLLWVGWPEARASGLGLIVLGVMHALRLARWEGRQTGREALVWVLHAGYAFVPLGALAMGLATLWPGLVLPAGVQHLWMAGAIGLMTLAVMTRATLGHTGRALHAGRGTRLIYAALIASVLARLAAAFWPLMALYHLAAGLWMLAFLGYVALYGPLLVRRAPGGG
ncbi:MAG: NnrS family protein [Roseovarius sp.]